MRIEQSATNAITITFNGERYLFMGEDTDFNSETLETVFRAIAQVYITD